MTSPITTHVLDTARGRPAHDLPIRLEHQNARGEWLEVSRGVTDEDGRITDLMEPGSLEEGLYRLLFDTRTYHHSVGQEGFYGWVPIVFRVDEPSQHYHVPLLLSPFGYSTYRGS